MKNLGKMKKSGLVATLIMVLFLMTNPLAAQSTHPGDPGGDPQVGGDSPLGGGAPIGGGTFILMALGAAYGGKKLMTLKQDNKNKH